MPAKPRLKTVIRWIAALFFVFTGLSHFVNPDPFLLIMPPFLPAPLALVYISGFFEIAGGIGLLIPQTRRWAAWGLVALLIAVFPANIHMLVNEIYLPNMPKIPALLWGRLPFQFLFIFVVVWTGAIWPKPKETISSDT